MDMIPKFLQGVFPFKGTGLSAGSLRPVPLNGNTPWRNFGIISMSLPSSAAQSLGKRLDSFHDRFDSNGTDLELRDLGDGVERLVGEVVGGADAAPMKRHEQGVEPHRGLEPGTELAHTPARPEPDQITVGTAEAPADIGMDLDEGLGFDLVQRRDPSRL